jgi:hypothetical protein
MDNKQRAKKIAEKIIQAIDKMHDSKILIPMIIAEILKHYERYGLAELIINGWDWKPEREVGA